MVRRHSFVVFVVFPESTSDGAVLGSERDIGDPGDHGARKFPSAMMRHGGIAPVHLRNLEGGTL